MKKKFANFLTLLALLQVDILNATTFYSELRKLRNGTAIMLYHI